MKKLLNFAVVAGLLVVGRAAMAGTPSATFTVNPANSLASGTFNVTLTKTGANTFSISVTGNLDGRNQDKPIGTATGTPGTPPKSGLSDVILSFTDLNGNPISVLQNTGGSSTIYNPAAPGQVAGVGNPNNVGGPNNRQFGTLGGAWLGLPLILPNANLSYLVGINLGKYVAPHGGNQLDGTFILNSPYIGGVNISLAGSGQQWSLSQATSITPESSSLALILPALLPLGFALRRRSKRSQ
jgi:hypothetical protein